MKKSFLTVLAGSLTLSLTAAFVEIRATSDLHGRLARLARLESLLKTNDPNVLRIDAGDSAAGGFEAQQCGLPGVLTILHELHFDVWVPGNHDFEVGEAKLNAAVKNFHGTVLGADWCGKQCQPAAWNLFVRNGFRIAVIGLTDSGMLHRYSFRPEFTFLAQAEALARVMPEVRKARPDLVILVRHGGLYDARGSLYALLRPYPEIQLVIGGHTHQRIPGVRVGSAWFVQPGCHGEVAVSVTAEFEDRSRRLIRFRSALQEGEDNGTLPVSRSPTLSRELSASRRRSGRIMARTAEPLRWPDSRRDRQASLGRWAAALLLRAVPEAEVACLSLPVRQGSRPLTGAVTAYEFFRIFPYENRLRLVEITPENLNRLLADKEFCRYAVLFLNGAGVVNTAKGWRYLQNKKTVVRLVTTEYLAASHPLLRHAPGRTLPLTDLAAAARVLAEKPDQAF